MNKMEVNRISSRGFNGLKEIPELARPQQKFFP